LAWMQLARPPEGISFTRKLYNCRIDRTGNYFARYESFAMNSSDKNLTHIPIYLVTDSTESLSQMLFTVLDEQLRHLNFSVINDEPHAKHVDVSVGQIRPRMPVAIAHFFRIAKAMKYSGDIDSFDIRNTTDCEISINTFYRLSGVKAFTVRSDRLIDELHVTEKKEQNKTYSYAISHENKRNDDSILFYYEGYVMDKIRTKVACPTKIDIKVGDILIEIRTAQEEDLPQIAELERAIEGREARALPVELLDRLRMFSDGFIIAHAEGKIVAYIETLLWRSRRFTAFEDIRSFPLFLDVLGDELYVIFVATANDWRGRGVATALLAAAANVAQKYNVSRIGLVAKRSLVPFYQKRGFQEVESLPEFLGKTEGILMRKEL